MRLFVALDIDSAIREGLTRFVSEVKDLAPEARWVGTQTFHITLKFIGEQSPQKAEAIRDALAAIAAPPVQVAFRGVGFFPNERSARVFWAGVDGDANLALLARRVDECLTGLQVPREDRPFSPHLTLARGGDRRHPRGGSGRPHFKPGDKANTCFLRLLERLREQPVPEFGAMTATEFFLYESKLSPGGALYTRLAGFPLVTV